MAAVNVFIGKSKPMGNRTDTSIVTGSSTTSTLQVELRILTTDGSDVLTNVTHMDVLLALDHIRSYIIKGGKQLLGTALPLPGPGPIV